MIRDVTWRQKAAAQAREHQTELAHASRVSLAGEMAAGLAHELSQPLTAIATYGRGCLRLLAGPAHEPAMLHEGVSEIVQQADRAGDVLSRLREFMRAGACRRTLVEVAPLIDAAVSLARIEATQHDVGIEVRVDPDLPPILADRIQIEQVMLNLLKNAHRFDGLRRCRGKIHRGHGPPQGQLGHRDFRGRFGSRHSRRASR